MTLYYNPEKTHEMQIQEAYSRGFDDGHRVGYKEAYETIMKNLEQFEMGAISHYPPDAKKKIILNVAAGKSIEKLLQLGHD